jgi:AcrR family transcriptional regulator
MTDTWIGASRTARERARAELTREIKEEARRQLAIAGAEGLSLRAVARQLGMASSALYRYYPSRDDLLTALIVDAYNAMGESAERAIADVVPDASGMMARARWLAACHAIRAWAVANPHEYALIYGSPVPGYRAPRDTIGPAARVPLAFIGVLRDALATGETLAGDDQDAEAELGAGPLAVQAATLAAALAAGTAGTDTTGTDTTGTAGATDAGAPAGPGVPPWMLVRAVIAWTQLYGMLSFELFGQFVGSFEPADAFFAHASAQLAAFAGLRVS